MNIQVRSEETGLGYFNTMEEAFEAAEKDKTIWKVSFNLPSGKRMQFFNGFRYRFPHYTYDKGNTRNPNAGGIMWELREVIA